MVLLTTTPQILEVLSSLPPSALSTLISSTSTSTSTTSTDTDTNIKTPDSTTLPTTLNSPISHHTLIALSKLQLTTNKNETTRQIPTLNTLLRGTRPYVPPPQPKPPQTQEYLALMARLRAEQEQRDYAALIAKKRNSLAVDLGMTTSPDEEEDNISPSLVLNITLSVVMCAVAMFQLTKWWGNDGVRVLMSLGTGVVVGVAEVGVYSIYLMKVRDARRKERGKRERKVFIGEYLPEGVDGDDGRMKGVGGMGKGKGKGDKEGEGVRVVGDREEIWGRGVNGGVRRRVREKWEKDQEQEKTGS